MGECARQDVHRRDASTASDVANGLSPNSRGTFQKDLLA